LAIEKQLPVKGILIKKIFLIFFVASPDFLLLQRSAKVFEQHRCSLHYYL
jgi:hypothetical protein